MMHIIVRDGLQDQDYVDRYTLGFDKLKSRLEEFPPSRVSQITGIPEQTIERLTHRVRRKLPRFYPR